MVGWVWFMLFTLVFNLDCAIYLSVGYLSSFKFIITSFQLEFLTN